MILRAAHRAVLSTRSIPGLAALYRGGYAGAMAVCARALRGLPGVSGVTVHRGTTRPGWEPGVSDIDLILRLDGPVALPRLEARLRLLKRVFPMLGDVWAGTGPEIEDYLRWGGLRAWEDAPHWRLLSGAATPRPASAETPEKRRWLDPWVWACVSHLELGRRFFRPDGGLKEKREADFLKLYLDSRRYSDFILAEDGAGSLPATRARARESLNGEARLPARALWVDSALRLSRASRLVLERLATQQKAAADIPAAIPGSPQEDFMNGLLSSCPAALGAVVDAPYHAYLFLEESASAAAYEEAADALLRRSESWVPAVLEPSAWALALQSSYLGAPLGWLGSGPGRGSEAGRDLFPGHGACSSEAGPGSLPLLSEGLRRETAAEAASWMALWWRSLWIAPGMSNRFVLFHLVTRALGLRLALAGAPSGPFCDWELLIARSAERFPAEAADLSSLRRLLGGETAASLDSTERGGLPPGHLRAVERLMDAFRGRLNPSTGFGIL